MRFLIIHHFRIMHPEPSRQGQSISSLKPRILIIAALITTITSGCFVQFGNTNTRTAITPDSLQQLINNGKFLIVHFANQVVAVKSATVANQQLTGETNTIPEEHRNFLHARNKPNINLPEGKFRVKEGQKTPTFEEVHLYTQNTLGGDPKFTLPVNDIRRIDIFIFDKKATKDNKVSSIIGLTLGFYLFLMSILYIASPVPDF